jgi:hypothetical protein
MPQLAEPRMHTTEAGLMQGGTHHGGSTGGMGQGQIGGTMTPGGAPGYRLSEAGGWGGLLTGSAAGEEVHLAHSGRWGAPLGGMRPCLLGVHGEPGHLELRGVAGGRLHLTSECCGCCLWGVGGGVGGSKYLYQLTMLHVEAQYGYGMGTDLLSECPGDLSGGSAASEV